MMLQLHEQIMFV